jgi:hypothetical protein
VNERATFQLPRDVLEDDYRVTLRALEEAARRIAALEAENAALWAFVGTYNDARESGDTGDLEATWNILAAKYEDKS